jgi:hypothetical protein
VLLRPCKRISSLRRPRWDGGIVTIATIAGIVIITTIGTIIIITGAAGERQFADVRSSRPRSSRACFHFKFIAMNLARLLRVI